MFDKFKDLYNLKKQAQEMQGKLAKESVTGVSRNGGLSLTLNGNQEMLDVRVAETLELTPATIEKSIKEAYTDAQNKLKHILAASFKDLL